MATSKNGLLLLLCVAAPLLLLLMSTPAAATQFRVGGSTGWKVPTEPNAMSYNQWAQSKRFKIGDSLLFVYQGGDSVLQVSQDSYNTCNTSSYIHKFSDGNTVFALDRSGPYYFISGVENNCLRNESLVVVVLSDRSTSSSSLSPSPTPSSPMASTPPPSSPPSEVSPPPSPSTTSPPPPPPPTPSEVAPSPSSTTGGGTSSTNGGGTSSPSPPPSKNGAISLKTSFGFLGTFGALMMGSLLLL